MSLHNVQLERALLGAVLRDPSVLGRHAITPDLFWLANHAKLAELLGARFLSGHGADAEQLVAWLAEHELTTAIGGPTKIYELIAEGDRDAGSLTEHLARLATKRAAIRRMKETHHALRDPAVDYSEALAGLVADLTTKIASGRHLSSVGDVVGRVYTAESNRLREHRGRRVRTGIAAFDKAFDGVSQRGLSLFISASGVGKTTLANRFAIALSRALKVVVHGTETTEEERSEDLLFSLARIDREEWDRLLRDTQRDLFEEDRFHEVWSRLTAAATELSELPITLSSKVGGTVEAFVARLRALRIAGKCDLAIVDYIQDFQWSTAIRRGDMLSQIGHATTMLKDASADLGIPVLAFGQRSDEKRGITPASARPQMWDCQYSSRAHQDAEEVYALFRNDYYLETIKDWPANLGNPGVIEVIRRKVRIGRRGTAELAWDGPTKWVGDPHPLFPPMPRRAR